MVRALRRPPERAVPPLDRNLSGQHRSRQQHPPDSTSLVESGAVWGDPLATIVRRQRQGIATHLAAPARQAPAPGDCQSPAGLLPGRCAVTSDESTADEWTADESTDGATEGATGEGAPRPAPARTTSCGSRTVKVVWPDLHDTDTEPPCALTTASTMARPSPVDPAARERDESPRTNRLKISGCSASGMPGPLSVTVMTDTPGSVRSPDQTVVPAGVCVRALA